MVDFDEPKSVDSALDLLLSPPLDTPIEKRSKRPLYWKLTLSALVVGLFVLFSLYAFWWRAPAAFPQKARVTVKEGMTLNEVSILLAEKNVIRSPFWFKAWSVVLGKRGGVKAGEYYLSSPVSVVEIANRLTEGLENSTPIRVTIPEGLSNAKIAALLSKSLPHFDPEKFLRLAAKKEGYLFPDTYNFSLSSTEEQIIEEMEQNFERRTLPLKAMLDDFGKPLHDVLTLASLVEGEVRTTETRRRVSGILWKRLSLGMPLQVDAVFPYIMGKNTFEVTTEDLKVDSPYNTYRYPGLPPGPINNPSLDSIMAAITPIPSEYLYYLTDTKGEMHYATTHAQHLVNREKYLGK